MFNNKNKIIEMQEKTIKEQKEIIYKKDLENIMLKNCIQKIEEKIIKAENQKTPFAVVVSDIKELVTDVENHN